MRTLMLFWIVLTLLLFSTATLAEPVQESRPIAADARVNINAMVGQINIQAENTDEFRLTGKLGEEVEELEIRGDRDAWVINLRPKDESSNTQVNGTTLNLTVPKGISLQGRVVSGGFAVRGLEGERLSLKAVSGDLNVDARPARLDLATVSGDIHLKGSGQEENRLRSVSGRVLARDLQGRVEAENVSGVIEIEGRDIRSARLQTVSAALHASLKPEHRASIEAQSHSGEIRLALPSGLPLNLTARSHSGQIESELGGEAVRSRQGPGNTLEFQDGAGSLSVRLQSFSGHIRLEEH